MALSLALVVSHFASGSQVQAGGGGPHTSGEGYAHRSLSITHEEIDGVVEFNGAAATSFKSLLSPALLAQSQGRDVRVEFTSTSIKLIPRGHPAYDDNPPGDS